MYDPVDDEPSECATIKRNITALSRQKIQLRSQLDRESANVERLRHTAEAARSNLNLAKRRAKAGKDRDGRPGGRPSKWEWLQQGAELAETVAETFLQDWTRQSRRADADLDRAERNLAETQRRWEETDRLLLHNERLFEQTDCRGPSINHRIFR